MATSLLCAVLRSTRELDWQLKEQNEQKQLSWAKAVGVKRTVSVDLALFWVFVQQKKDHDDNVLKCSWNTCKGGLFGLVKTVERKTQVNGAD